MTEILLYFKHDILNENINNGEVFLFVYLFIAVRKVEEAKRQRLNTIWQI